MPSKKNIIIAFDELINLVKSFKPKDETELTQINSFVNSVKVRNELLESYKIDIERHNKAIKAIPLEVYDFKDISCGTFVMSSMDFAMEYEHNPCMFTDDDNKFFRGIIVGKEFKNDDLCEVVTYPVVHWEGFPDAMETHPKDVTMPLNSDIKLNLITMNANQLNK